MSLAQRTKQFPVGYRDLHPDYAVNFQLNRWLTYLGEESLEEIEPVLPRLVDFAANKREFLALGEKALAEGRLLNAAYYLRSAEFFMFADDADKRSTRQRFLELAWRAQGLTADDRHLIPYAYGSQSGFLPAYRFAAEAPAKGVIVIHGGFDSYVEEFFPMCSYLTDAGYDVILFDGPGQGGALEEFDLAMTPDWHVPTGLVLDYFGVEDVTLIGVSMGGCMVLRAAAFEPRVKRAIAWDAFYDSFSVWLGKLTPRARAAMKTLLALHGAPFVNMLMYRAMSKSMALEWAIRHGMHVTRTDSPYTYLNAIRAFTTADISADVKQHVLVMAGSEDWSAPVSQFYRQIEALTNVRSLTARLFTRGEQGHQHCQVGNLGLALDYMLNWIEFHTAEDVPTASASSAHRAASTEPGQELFRAGANSRVHRATVSP